MSKKRKRVNDSVEILPGAPEEVLDMEAQAKQDELEEAEAREEMLAQQAEAADSLTVDVKADELPVELPPGIPQALQGAKVTMLTGNAAKNMKLLSSGNLGELSDGYHTFNELYRHRNLLFLNLVLFSDFPRSWREDPNTPGWFIVTLQLLDGQISYHLPIGMQPLIKGFVEHDEGPEFDGHTSIDVIDRLEKNIHYWRNRLKKGGIQAYGE